MNRYELLFDSFRQLKRLIFHRSHMVKPEKASTKLQFATLSIMKELEPLAVGELAKQMKLSKSSMTQLLDRLVKMNWVERVHASEDRRKVQLKLTKSGQKAVVKLRQNLIKEMEEIFGFLEKKDIDDLLRVHAKIINHFNSN